MGRRERGRLDASQPNAQVGPTFRVRIQRLVEKRDHGFRDLRLHTVHPADQGIYVSQDHTESRWFSVG
jgi:hypothetical protein